MGDFQMPALGADMEEGTIVEWKVGPGDVVHHGDVIAVVETDKANIDAEVFEDGVIGELLVAVGDKVPIGTVLATVVAPGDARPAPVSPTPVAPVVAPPVIAVPATTGPMTAVPALDGRVLSPLVRHLAEREGVDLHRVKGTGLGGLITRADVDHAHAARARVSPRARRLAEAAGVDLTAINGSGPGGAVVGADVRAPTPRSKRPPTDRRSSMRQRIAALMERSNRDIPHYWVTLDIDMAPATAWLHEHNAVLPPNQRMLPAALLVAATARAAACTPTLNGHWIDGELHPAATVDLGIITVLRSGGLLVPVLPDAASRTATETMAALADVVRRARSDHLRASDVAMPSITVSNLGDQGADEVLGVIYPPQVALVGFGRITERPWARNGMVGARPVVTASVAGDHRASDGHEASRFLAAVARLLDDPAQLEEVS